ncbi:hypothetical protein Pcinc_015023 [Petrolisthes cinctipes]|uniref:Peroxisomal membrane protein PEX13 n=1 Tax=Petrolisthes cinctipes TaxID=88211 RepID=A0AAE1KNL0_PETCI|nr:hypothetical protein Pcinc_015023 [Petrolisthes cinctipes]
MAAPTKLWERQQQQRPINYRQHTFNPDTNNSFMPSSPFQPPGSGGGGGLSSGHAPPLPQRPTTSSLTTYGRPSYGNYGGYGSYGNYGVGTYGGYGNMGRYGMIGGPSNLPVDENGFIRLAEESSRPAFESIESIVHAVGSVSMMLESTYHAVHSSFRAVLGVAEHFGRMKSHFAQIFSALAVVRTLRWVHRKLLYLIGLRVQDPSLEAAWKTAGSGGTLSANQITEADIKASKSSWPIVMFLVIVFSGPYLIWRLLSSLVPARNTSKDWTRGRGEHYAAQVIHNFKAGARQELSAIAGQTLYIAPRDQQPSGVRGWLLASNGTACGLVPANYIRILPTRPANNPNPSPMMHQQQGLNQGPGVARRMPVPTNPQMTDQLRPMHPQYRPSPQIPHNVQHPSSLQHTHLQNSQSSSNTPSQPFQPQSSSNPRPPIQFSTPQSKEPSLQQHSLTNPQPLRSQPSLVSQYQSDSRPHHNQPQPPSQNQLPGPQNGKLEQFPQPSQADSQARQHPPEKYIDYGKTRESGHGIQDLGSEMKDQKGNMESKDPGSTPSFNWNEFTQHENRWMEDRGNKITGNSDLSSSDDENESSNESSDESL